jgi:hypothetical protein
MTVKKTGQEYGAGGPMKNIKAKFLESERFLNFNFPIIFVYNYYF